MGTGALTARGCTPLPQGTNHHMPKSWSIKTTGNLLANKNTQRGTSSPGRKQDRHLSHPSLISLVGSSSEVLEMAVNFTCSFATLCCCALWGFARTSDAMYVPPPHSTMTPGSPVPVNTNNPGVRKAARFGVYRYNNSSNDLFLFKESQINRALVQIVRGLKYMLHVEIERTVCEKREHSGLDSCNFQRKKNLQQMLRCYFEVWITPWLHKAHVPVALCR
ncbi:cystatin-F isoform X2 [Columba livia]|uniref:cystatin-F isoform X2 n=1 Tax=Columba livia TaxID=8932 RepID=UPI000A3D2A9F|nr:cystatin-F [Columba livia]KAK2523212.1 Cst7 [Columba livia]